VEVAVAGAPLAAMNAAVEAAFRALAQVHSRMSFHAAGSDVWRLNNQAWRTPVRVHAWTYQVVQTAADLHRRSSGAFDIAVAPVLQDMGWLPRARGGRPATSGNRTTTDAVELLPGQRIRFRHSGTKIDLGGIAKGFAVDLAINVLRRHGMPDGLVNAGGDLAVFGAGPHAVDIRDPRDPGRLLCCVGLRNEALASSATRFDPFRSSQAACQAVIDPRTCEPARGMLGATVRASCCMLADALTKVVMVAGPRAAQLLEQYGAGALVVAADGGVRMTRGFESAVRLAA
jgi:thiamine biosynthesis lipoprotein